MFANWYAQRISPNLENWINLFILCLDHSDAQEEKGMYSMSTPPVIVVADNSQSVQFSHWVVTDSLWPHGQQHTRLLCPSPTPRSCSKSCPSSQWCHPTFSFSVVPFSSCLQSIVVIANLINIIPLSTIIGEGNGTPLQYSCLENPMDGGAW